MAIVNDLIFDAYGEIGVYGPADTISTADLGVALRRLNLILDTWAAQPLMAMSISFYDLPITAGTSQYTIGPSGGSPIVGARPTRIRAARLAYPTSNPLFYPMDVLDVLQFADLSSSRYYDVGQTRPDTVVYNKTLPNATVIVLPVPDNAATIRLWYDYQPAPFGAISDSLALSQGYYKALMLQLALELAPSFGATASPITQAAWQDAIRSIKALNTVQQGTPYDSRSPGLFGRFDIRNGQTYGS
jgi:hypothetical protein